jgi:hypothetical protein
MILGATRTLVKRKGLGRTAIPTEVMGRAEPFPTTMEEGREGWEGGGRQYTCVRGGVIGCTRVSHLVRHRSGWGRRHRGEGASERLGIPPIGPGPPHGLGWRPREGKEPLLRWGRSRRRSRRWGGKEDRWGEESRHPRMARATCGWCQSTGCRGMANESHPESCPGHPTCHCDHPCNRDPPGARRLSKSSRERWCRGVVKPPGVRGGRPRGGVERCGRSGGRSGREKLLEKQVVLDLCKSGKRLHAGEDGSHTIEARAQTA